MAKNAMIRARIEPDLKAEVEQILNQLGLSTTEIVTLLYKQIKLQKALPFEVSVPKEKEDGKRRTKRIKD